MKNLSLSNPLILFCFVIVFMTSCKEAEVIPPVTPPTANEGVSGFLMLDENTPLGVAKLEITDMKGNLFYTGTTKEDGSFVIEKENVPKDASSYVVTFSKDEKAIQQLKLNTLVTNSSENSGKGSVFLDGEDDNILTRTVRILDKVTKKPLENAVFKLWTVRDGSGTVYEYVSDAEGLVTLKMIDSYYYPTYAISKEGYMEDKNVYGTWRTSTDIDHEIYSCELEPIFAPDNSTNNKISVYLKRMQPQDNGRPSIANHPLCARKIIIKGDNGFIDSAYTGDLELETGDRPGEVTFSGLKSGIYVVSHEAVVEEYAKAEMTVQLRGNETKQVNLTCYENKNRCKNNVLIVKFKDENGNPITGGSAKAEAVWVTEEWGGNVAISEDGSAIFTGIHQSEEQFWLNVSSGTKVYKRATTKPIIFRCGETVTIEQTLELESECDGTACNHRTNIGVNEFIRREPDYPYPNPPIMQNLCGVKVVVTGPNGFTHSEVTDSQKDGRVYLENLCPGTYTATVESDEYESTTIRFRINCWGAYIPLDEGGGGIEVYKKK